MCYKKIILISQSNTKHILKPSSNQSLFKLIISGQTLIKLNDFLPIYVYFNGQTLSSVFEQFSFFSKVFWAKNAKIDFSRKNGFESCFYKIDV